MAQSIFTHRFTLICDDIRREDNGKFIVIGLYTPDIVVPQIPFILPNLAFFQAIESHHAGQFQFSSSLELLESGAKLGQAIGIIEVKQPGLFHNILRFGNLKIQSPGAYTFTTTFSQSAEHIVHSFQIILKT